jgi:hypothetical protein
MVDDEINQTIVYENEVQGQPVSRIPGVVIANDGSVLVHAEIRELDNELGKFDLYVKRYVNNVLIHTIPVYVANETYGKGSGSAMVIDRTGSHGTAGKIWYFYNTFKDMYEYPSNQSDPSDIKLWYVTSTDNGVTWSSPVDISNLIPSESFGMLICPCDGIQASDGTLYISFYTFNRNTNRRSIGLYYLTPDSNNWQVAELVTGVYNVNESTLYEDKDGNTKTGGVA